METDNVQIVEMLGQLLTKQTEIERNQKALLELANLRLADWLTIEHAALLCDCSYDHIYRAVERRELPATDIGTGQKRATHRVSRSDLNAWMERNKGGKSLPPRSEIKSKMDRYLPGVA